MLQPLITPTPRSTRLIAPGECWEAMSRRRSPRAARRNSGGASAALLNPSQILGANLKIWCRADLGVTLNSTTVSAWADQSGAGNNLTQGTGTNQPTFIASGGSGIAGNADMSYAGSHFLIGTATDIVTTALTAFMIFKTSTLASGDQPWGKGFGVTEWLFAGASSPAGGLRFSIGGANNAISNAAVNNGAANYAVAVWDQSVSSGLITLYIGGVAQTTTATFSGTISGGDKNGTGAEISGANGFAAGYTGQLPEVGLANVAASGAQLTNLHAYLKARAGL